jgi:hypothetical protein
LLSSAELSACICSGRRSVIHLLWAEICSVSTIQCRVSIASAVCACAIENVAAAAAAAAPAAPARTREWNHFASKVETGYSESMHDTSCHRHPLQQTSASVCTCVCCFGCCRLKSTNLGSTNDIPKTNSQPFETINISIKVYF